jgi:hypothetical protein
MLLYHGTTATILDTILQEGIKPRGDKPSLWPDLPSRPDCAYMTDGHGFYFAVAVSGPVGLLPKVVFEIDTDRLDQRLLLPDEDFVVQLAMNVVGKQRWDTFTTDAVREFTREIKTHLEKYVIYDNEGTPGMFITDENGDPKQFDDTELAEVMAELDEPCWQVSVKFIATCAYKGTIPPSAITRYCIFDQQKRIFLAALSYNRAPGLSPDCLQRNEHARNLTKWFFGDRKKLPRYIPSDFIGSDNSELAAYLKKPNWDRESAWRMGVEIVNLTGR